MKIGLLRDSEDGIVSLEERIKQYLKSTGIDAVTDTVHVNKPSSKISRHHVFLYVIKENTLTEGGSKLKLLHKLREKKFQEVRRRCIIVIVMERPRNEDELQIAVQANHNGPLQMFDNRYDQIVYIHFDDEGNKPDHSSEVSIHHDRHQDMDKQKFLKTIQTLVLQNCFTQYSFAEIDTMHGHDVHNNDSLLSQSNVAKSKNRCQQS